MKKFPLHLDGKLSKISKSSKSHNLISRKSVPPFRSSRLQMFFKVNVLKRCDVATENHLRWSSSSPPALKPYKKKTTTMVFSCEYSKKIKNNFFHRRPLGPSLPFIPTIRNYYWKNRLVILFTSTHPTKQLNACFKVDTRKGRSRRVKSV